jgi:hypothetical protein
VLEYETKKIMIGLTHNYEVGNKECIKNFGRKLLEKRKC